MKKLTAILLLAIFLFNTTGYRWLISYLEVRDDKNMVATLDHNDYNEEDLVTIQVPLHLPYQTNWSAFERIDGSIQLDGKVYKYVKRKIYNGQLILMCLPDEQTRRLETAKDDFFKLANDLANQAPGKTPVNNTGVVKNFFSLYDKSEEQWRCLPFIAGAPHNNPGTTPIISIVTINTPGQPPDTMFA